MFLQGSTNKYLSLQGGHIRCQTRAKTCHINFGLRGSKNAEYAWSINGGEWIYRRDPTTLDFAHGIHTVVLRATRSEIGESLKKTFTISVGPIPSKTKSKVSSSIKPTERLAASIKSRYTSPEIVAFDAENIWHLALATLGLLATGGYLVARRVGYVLQKTAR